jgi:hypothetical protein
MTHYGIFHAIARMDTLYNGGDLGHGESCSVRLDDLHIRVEREVGGTGACDEGRIIAPGHYRQENSDTKKHATLHRSPRLFCLKGASVEDGERGTWRTELHELGTA